MLNAWATRLASMCHGTLVRSAASPTTGPATPKHAEPNPVAPDSTARKAEIISGRPEKSSVRNVRIASARGRDEVLSNTPSRVDVPPTSPTSTFVIDNRFILLHLDAVSPVCQDKRRSRACTGAIVTRRQGSRISPQPASGTGRRFYRQAQFAWPEGCERAGGSSWRHDERGRQREDDDARGRRGGVRGGDRPLAHAQ